MRRRLFTQWPMTPEDEAREVELRALADQKMREAWLLQVRASVYLFDEPRADLDAEASAQWMDEWARLHRIEQP
jgi:ABC-type sugar transport system ATPase subunit